MGREFAKNIRENIDALIEKRQKLNVCMIAEQMQEERFSAIYERLLKEGTFLALRDGYEPHAAGDPARGERVLHEEHMHALTEGDFDRLMALALPVCVEEGLTDGNGNYIRNWSREKVRCRQELIDFAIEKVVPSAFREDFRSRRLDYAVTTKLLRIIDGILAPAAAAA